MSGTMTPQTLNVLHIGVLSSQHQCLGDTVTVAALYTNALGVAAHVRHLRQPRVKSLANLRKNIFRNMCEWQVISRWKPNLNAAPARFE
jgi:hypothetical protein